jgi:hypothetical protein
MKVVMLSRNHTIPPSKERFPKFCCSPQGSQGTVVRLFANYCYQTRLFPGSNKRLVQGRPPCGNYNFCNHLGFAFLCNGNQKPGIYYLNHMFELITLFKCFMACPCLHISTHPMKNESKDQWEHAIVYIVLVQISTAVEVPGI